MLHNIRPDSRGYEQYKMMKLINSSCNKRKGKLQIDFENRTEMDKFFSNDRQKLLI